MKYKRFPFEGYHTASSLNDAIEEKYNIEKPDYMSISNLVFNKKILVIVQGFATIVLFGWGEK